LSFEIDVQAAEAAIRTWPVAFKGITPTRSILSSTPGEDLKQSSAPLWKFEMAKGSAVPVMRGEFSTVTPAPTGRRFAALLAVGRIRPEPGHILPNRNPAKYKLVVSDDPAIEAEDVVPGSVRWSRGGKLALQSRANKRPSDWVVVGGPNLTSSFQTPPSTIVPAVDRNAFFAAADGRLWLIDAATGAPQLDSRFIWPVNAILWSDGSHAVVTSGSELHAINLQTGEFRQLARPAADAEFKTFVAKNGTAVFASTGADGTSTLWYGEQRMAWINRFLAQILQGELQKIEYRSPDGRLLNAWLLLPPGYSDGHRLPTVVWVYAGLSYSDTPPFFSVRLNSSGPYNLQLLAARGYAVLLPSMPLKPEGQASDPYSELPDGVLPAVDKAIELGFSDPERVAVMGHSFGGYSVLGLITQTARFRAAISLSGFCNLMSLYGVLDTRFRFEDRARERLIHMVFAESGQFRMGAPPWEDAERYVRNSPLTYAGRVATPLLIVHGDMDYVPIQQAEEFFTAMYRQRKVASFVRYWGEGHIIQSPANVQDMWNRIFAWLQDHLR
jgi:dipeptidyl aminopeptidase/acylaminoacyl peptidase